MRMFFALEMPQEVCAPLARLIEPLRARARSVRWVNPAAIHLTLRFLGSVEPEQLDSILTAARCATGGKPRLCLRTTDLGTFPGGGRPRVIWIGLEDLDGSLHGLHDSLETALEQGGIPREPRAFSPHLTLGRVRRGADARGALSGARPPLPVAFEVGEVVLMASLLEPQGARYEVRSRLPLGGAA
ncbi:MAG: RNA 2',3'-cyclic phosphodiesterase [Acidobacteriota bacterium]